MLRAFFIAASFVVLAPLSYAGSIDVATIDGRIERLMDERGMVGLAVVIIEDGQFVHVKGYGETLAESGDKVTEETVFRWASLSKSVAATLVTKLDEDGALSLSASAANYSQSLHLPSHGERQASVQNVLSHQLGIVRNAFDNRLEGGVNAARIRADLHKLPIECEIGTCHAYQNVAYDSASEMVAKVTGESYQLAVKHHLFGPLGMGSASLTLQELQESPRWARPHNGRGFNVYRKMRDNYYRVPAAGGMNSNITDLGIWMRAQMGEMGAVISDNVREQTQRGRVGTTRETNRVRRYFPRLSDAQYGLGWRVYDYAGHKVVGHRGAVNGYRAMILFDPLTRDGVAALWNSGSNQPVGIQMEVMDMAYGLKAQDWLYLGAGPNLAKIRAQHPEVVQLTSAPFPRLSPYLDRDNLPAGHGVTHYEVKACFGL
ncbi:MAG: serine hydrolase domain-containing protein [Robiginitomaculum sp.]